jgi:NADH-quinone oxidoreductase subunit E
VECLGACVNAPVIQINDDFYEDLSPESVKEIFQKIKDGKKLKIGSQMNRQCSKATSC